MVGGRLPAASRCGGGGCITPIKHLYLLFLLFCFSTALTDHQPSTPARQNLDISIGIGIGVGGGGGNGTGGGDCGYPPIPPPPPPPVVCPPPTPPPPPPLNQELQQALSAIRKLLTYVTDDPNNITQTWTGDNPCEFKGFFCAARPGDKVQTIGAVDFNHFNIEFQRPALNVIGCFKDLAIFHANSNRFKGTIPASFTKFKYLFELDLSNNLLSGSFPTIAACMNNLSYFDIRFNKFAGFVAPSIFNLDLDVFFLNNDAFGGPIPDAIGNSPVSVLSFANNNFTGNIPTSIKRMSKTLVQVLFLNNQLSGCLPPEIGYLNEATVFDAGGNQLTGPIPLSFGCLKKVEQLNLAHNLLYGEIPEAICELGSLANVSLSHNYFTWEGPACRRLAERGLLDDRWNCIPSRPNQRPPEECAAFDCQPKYCPDSPFNCGSELPCPLPSALLRPSPRITT